MTQVNSLIKEYKAKVAIIDVTIQGYRDIISENRKDSSYCGFYDNITEVRTLKSSAIKLRQAYMQFVSELQDL